MKPSQKPIARSIPQDGQNASSVISDGNIDFLKIYRLDPQERIDAIKRGVPAETIAQLSEKMDIPKGWLIGTLGLSRAALSRRERDRKPLSTDESERVIGVQALIGQVEKMVAESGDPVGFDAAKWLSNQAGAGIVPVSR